MNSAIVSDGAASASALVPVLELEKNPDALARIPRSLAFASDVLPLEIYREGLDDVLVLGVADPGRFAHRHLDSNGDVISLSRTTDDDGVAVSCPDLHMHRTHIALRRAAQADRLVFKAVPAETLRNCQQRWYGPARQSNGSAIAQAVDKMLEDAVLEHAHDIKIEPMNTRLRPYGRIRFFVLGRGRLYRTIETPEEFDGIVATLKTRTLGMDMTKKRIQQDGRMEFALPHREVAVRMSSFPTRRIEPETLTGRILDLHLSVMPPAALGMRDDMVRRAQRAVHMNGALVIGGAPGAGKSTSAESFVSLRNDVETSVVAIGDPVETPQYGVLQVEVDENNGLSPLGILKGMTRHAPDCGNAGECRDPEYTDLAFDLAGIRPMVLTVHADGAIDVVYELTHRLRLEPETVERHVHTIFGQHLIGRICRECRRPVETPAWLQAMRPNDDRQVYEAGSCGFCHGGFVRRFGVFEVLPISKPMRRAIADRKSQIELEAIAESEGFVPMLEDAISRVFEGETAITELFDVPGFHERMREIEEAEAARARAEAS